MQAPWKASTLKSILENERLMGTHCWRINSQVKHNWLRYSLISRQKAPPKMHEDAKQQNLDLEVWKSEDAPSTLSCISIICIHYSSMRTATKDHKGLRWSKTGHCTHSHAQSQHAEYHWSSKPYIYNIDPKWSKCINQRIDLALAVRVIMTLRIWQEPLLGTALVKRPRARNFAMEHPGPKTWHPWSAKL
jgi:hypothetical protein